MPCSWVREDPATRGTTPFYEGLMGREPTQGSRPSGPGVRLTFFLDFIARGVKKGTSGVDRPDPDSAANGCRYPDPATSLEIFATLHHALRIDLVFQMLWELSHMWTAREFEWVPYSHPDISNNRWCHTFDMTLDPYQRIGCCLPSGSWGQRISGEGRCIVCRWALRPMGIRPLSLSHRK